MSKINLYASDNENMVIDNLNAIAAEIDSLNLGDDGLVIISIPEDYPESAQSAMRNIFKQVAQYTESKGINTSLGVIIWRGHVDVTKLLAKDLNALGWYKRKPRAKKPNEDVMIP